MDHHTHPASAELAHDDLHRSGRIGFQLGPSFASPLRQDLLELHERQDVVAVLQHRPARHPLDARRQHRLQPHDVVHAQRHAFVVRSAQAQQCWPRETTRSDSPALSALAC